MDFWSFASSSANDNEPSGKEEECRSNKSNSTRGSHPVKLTRKMNGAVEDPNLYNDMEEKKLQIVEEEIEVGKNYLGNVGHANNNTEHVRNKGNLKIGGKFALKFRSLIELEYVQSFIQEADFVFYQYIVDFLIPKVCIILHIQYSIHDKIIMNNHV